MDVTRHGEALQHFCALLPKGPPGSSTWAVDRQPQSISDGYEA